MAKRSLSTPRSQVRSAIRQLWLRSRERQGALKRDHYTCQECGKKQSKAKGREVAVEVHHKSIDMKWETVIDYIMGNMLCSPDNLVTLCKGCHGKITQGRKVK
jgi:5-methylcytosine-specific restriction endonuclease McrA